jgi:hypothetical protein
VATTLADLRTKVLYRLGLPTTDAMVPNADLDQSINNGLDAMAADYDWPWLYSEYTANTTPGTNLFSTGDKQRVLWVAYGSDLLTLSTQEDMIRFADRTGQPTYWTSAANALYVHPVPDAAYTLKVAVIQVTTPLTTGTDVANVPDMYSSLAVIYAAMEHAVRLKDTKLFSMLSAQKDAWLKRVKDNARFEAGTVRIRTRTDWVL